MPDEHEVLRGAPRYIRGPAAGGRGVIALVPEARLGAGGRRVHTAQVIELLPGGLRRHVVGARPARRRAPIEGPALPAISAGTGATVQIVAGDGPPTEDPRLAAAFGPAEEISGGVRIPLADVILGPGGAPARTIPRG